MAATPPNRAWGLRGGVRRHRAHRRARGGQDRRGRAPPDHRALLPRDRRHARAPGQPPPGPTSGHRDPRRRPPVPRHGVRRRGHRPRHPRQRDRLHRDGVRADAPTVRGPGRTAPTRRRPRRHQARQRHDGPPSPPDDEAARLRPHPRLRGRDRVQRRRQRRLRAPDRRGHARRHPRIPGPRSPGRDVRSQRRRLQPGRDLRRAAHGQAAVALPPDRHDPPRVRPAAAGLPPLPLHRRRRRHPAPPSTSTKTSGRSCRPH